MQETYKNNPPVVSIIMLAYNHAHFIGQAIESIVCQQANFRYQLIIGIDASPDNTLQICEEYKALHPDKITILNQKVNIGGQPNFFACYELAKATKYVGFCEGDDYWEDPLKLQKQVDFLNKNEDFALCFTEARIEFYNQKSEPYLLNANMERDVFSIDDLIGEDEVWFMATASLLYRTTAIGELPQWMLKSKSGDIPLAILATRNGKIKYIKDSLVVYRKHAGGISLTDYKDDVLFLENRIYMYSHLMNDTPEIFAKRFKQNIAKYYFLMLSSKQLKGKYWQKLPIALKIIRLTYPNVFRGREVMRDHVIPAWMLRLKRKVMNGFR